MTSSAAPVADAPPVAVFRLPLEDKRPEHGEPLPGGDRERLEPLLRQNAVWFCRLRWMVVAALCGAGVAGLFPNQLTALGLAISPGAPFTAAAILAGLNWVFVILARRADVPVQSLLWGQIVSDLLVLTAVIHWIGHELPAAPFMYLFHIVLACIVFKPGESLAVAGLAAAFFILSLLLESRGYLPKTSIVISIQNSRPPAVTGCPAGYGVAPMLLIWAVIWYLVSRLANTLRARDRELFMANRKLEASIEERSGHMLQTTHELKAPFAAIHAQAQLLTGGYCGALPAQARTVADKISARCLVLARRIQEMLQLANLRSQSQAPSRADVRLDGVIERVVARIEPAARHRGIRFEKEIHPFVLHAVEDHLTMLVDNLLVNAVNYSYDQGVVHVTCCEQAAGDAVFTVRDQGIGIPREKLPRIFDDYYRTEEAAQHNAGSTGLGLAIVRQVAREYRLPVQVESAPGWGTRFTVIFPGATVAPDNPTPPTHN